MRIIQSANPRPLNLLAVGPGGRVAAASGVLGASEEVEVWDAATGARTLARPGGGPQVAVAFAPDGRLLAADRFGLGVCDATTGAPVRRLSFGWAGASCVSADATRTLAAGAGRTASVTAWALDAGPDGPAGALRWLWNDPNGPFDAPALGRTGARAATLVRADGTSGRPTSAITVRDGDSGRPLCSLPIDPASSVRQLQFTADDSKLLIRADGRTVYLMGADTGAPAGELVHPGRPFVTAVAAHPGGPVACARTDGTVTFWDPHTRAKIRTLDWKAGRLVSVAFSPDGAMGAAGTEDGQVVVWDVDL